MYTTFAVVAVTFGLLLWSTVWIWEWYKKEPIIAYEITPPSQPDERKILEKPTIKVPHQHIHS